MWKPHYSSLMTKMDKLIYFPVLWLFLCCVLDSSKAGRLDDASPTVIKGQPDDTAVAFYTEEQLSKAKLRGPLPCSNCYRRKSRFPTSISEEIQELRNISPSDTPTDAMVPKESRKITFSRKYSPELGTQKDGFMPVPGPYGKKSRNTGESAFKPTPVSNPYKSGSESRYAGGPPKFSTNYDIQPQHFNHPQSFQRRSQYRSPKVLRDDLSVKESIPSENILGNGNFEIIRGGIYSDQDTNEILGSRRVSRGYGGSYGVPSYRDNGYRTTQNVQFPPFNQRNQNPVHPLFFPRASY